MQKRDKKQCASTKEIATLLKKHCRTFKKQFNF